MKKKNNDWKKREGIVFSTSDEFEYEDTVGDEETLAPEKQNLRVLLDKKQRKGKVVTLVSGFEGSEEDLKDLAKTLKSKCGVGGTAKDGEILIQGDFREKIVQILQDAGYRKTKKAGG